MQGQNLIQEQNLVEGQNLKLTSLVARSVADMAESYRGAGGDPGYLVTTYDEAGQKWTTTFQPQGLEVVEPVSNERQVVTPVNTATVAPRRKVTGIGIQAEGMLAPESLAQYDAVFWSESAVEKFLFPYYASKGQWAAATVLAALSELFYGKLPTPDDSPDTDDEVPFAVAHLPRSTYQNLTETATPGTDLAVLSRSRKTGKVTHQLLSHHLQRRAEAGGAPLTAAPQAAERARPAGGRSRRTAAARGG